MNYFLDSAKIDEIRYAYANWGINGVTSNPRHILASGKPFFTVIRELAEEFKGKDFPISVEINPHLEDAKSMVAEARGLAAMSQNFVIKIPCTEQGLAAAKELVEAGVRTNVTLVFSASQALQAGRIGAEFVSPFIGWKESSGEEVTAFIGDVTAAFFNYGISTKIIVAAVRNGRQIVESAVAGAHIVTAGFDVLKESFYHPFTDLGLQRFRDAWDSTDTRS